MKLYFRESNHFDHRENNGPKELSQEKNNSPTCAKFRISCVMNLWKEVTGSEKNEKQKKRLKAVL